MVFCPCDDSHDVDDDDERDVLLLLLVVVLLVLLVLLLVYGCRRTGPWLYKVETVL